jgi:glyoxylase-like metal-dependent hydrolase (beta-lactamase superfamily II)
LQASTAPGCADPAAVATATEASPQANPFTGHVNAFTVNTGSKLYLIDAGGPAAFIPSLGRFSAGLAAAGIAPEQVDQVLLTHLHVDHIAGLTDTNGQAVFPNAGLTMLAEEHAFWTAPGFLENGPEPLKPLIAAAQAAVAAYADRLTLLSGEAEAAPGITTLPIPGHTPGMTGYRITSGDRQLLMWGDTVHIPALQFAHPDWHVAFDTDGPTAVTSRAKVLDMVTADRIPVLGSHLPFPGHGHVLKSGSAYAYEAAFWDHFA